MQRRKYDPPFLNRFEKQYFNLFENFSEEERELITQLEEWMERIGCIGKFDQKDLLPSLTKSTIPSIVYKFHFHPRPFDACKDALMWLFSWDGAVRASTREPEVLEHYYRN